MSNRGRSIGLGLLFLIGLLILMYPYLSNKWNDYRAQQLITNYSDTVKKMSNVDYAKELEQAREYNKSLIGSEVPDAFSVRDGVRDKTYEEILDITGNGMIGTVEIPSIDERIPIYHYTHEDVLLKGAGHLFGSSLPVGGDSSHTVITAHRGLPSARLFTDLNLMNVGDVFVLHVLKDDLYYKVDSIETVEPADTGSLAIREGKDLATLVTCTPYAINTHRLLVHAHRTTSEDAGASNSKRIAKGLNRLLWVAVCVSIGFALAILLLKAKELFVSKRNRR